MKIPIFSGWKCKFEKSQILILRGVDRSRYWQAWLVFHYLRNLYHCACSVVMIVHPLCFLICISQMDLSACFSSQYEMVLNRHHLWLLEPVLRNRLYFRWTYRNNLILPLLDFHHLDLQPLCLFLPSISLKTFHLVGIGSNRGSFSYNGRWYCDVRNQRRNLQTVKLLSKS